MFPAEHRGFVEKRFWYKVIWKKQPPGEAPLIGKFDLLMAEQYEKYREFVDVLQKVSAPLCASGISLSFGTSSEEQIDAWIRENAEPATTNQ